MWKSRRLLTLLGVGVAAGFAALVLPTAARAAEGDGGMPGFEGPYETCDGAVCLVMEPLTRASFEGPDADWVYSGIRPLLTDWKGDQLYNVEYTGEDGEAVNAGSYLINIENFWNVLYNTSAYQFGDFVPNADVSDGLDLGWYDDLSGASVYEVNMFNGAFTNLTINNVGPHDASYWVMSAPGWEYTVVSAEGASTAYMQLGDSDPLLLWGSGFHGGLFGNEVPDHLIPDSPFSGLDFDPNDYWFGELLDNLFSNWS